MNVIKLHSIMSRGFNTNIVEVADILNELIDDGEDLLAGTKFEYLNIVDGQRFYKLKGSGLDVSSMLFQNTNGAYVPINRFVGKSDTGEIE